MARGCTGGARGWGALWCREPVGMVSIFLEQVLIHIESGKITDRWLYSKIVGGCQRQQKYIQ